MNRVLAAVAVLLAGGCTSFRVTTVSRCFDSYSVPYVSACSAGVNLECTVTLYTKAWTYRARRPVPDSVVRSAAGADQGTVRPPGVRILSFSADTQKLDITDITVFDTSLVGVASVPSPRARPQAKVLCLSIKDTGATVIAVSSGSFSVLTPLRVGRDAVYASPACVTTSSTRKRSGFALLFQYLCNPLTIGF